MRRREFITVLGGAAAAWPMAATAQQASMPVIGFLHPTSRAAIVQGFAAFHQGLGEIGYFEGRNVAVEYRWADGHNERMPALAAELAARKVTVLAAAQGDTSARAAKGATSTIPIIFMTASDPVEIGLVGSLNRPDGNMTGVSRFSALLMPKRLEILCEAMPNAPMIDLLVNPSGAIAASGTKDLEAVAPKLGRELRVHMATNEAEIEAAFVEMAQLHARALIVMADSFFSARDGRIAGLSLRHGIATIFNRREFAAAGGLMSYDSSLSDAFRIFGVYTGRVLKGERPANLPVQQPIRVELIINMITAKALGIQFPITLLGRADEVIE